MHKDQERSGTRSAVFAAVFAALLAGCAALEGPIDTQTAAQAAPALCATDEVVIDVAFDGGSDDACQVVGETFQIVVTPEDTPINPSPWYAMRMTRKTPGDVNITLSYPDGWHRYLPKISHDGDEWSALDTSRVKIHEDGLGADLRVPVTEGSVYLAGQELLTADDYEAWMRSLAVRETVTSQIIGTSIEKRPLHMLAHKAGAGPRKTILLVGRQHPPEVTGGFAMKHFVDEVFSDSPRSKAFLNTFNVVLVPLMNPDGVANGNWRHNMGGVDLNRDWGPFTQPETQAVKAMIDEIDADPAQELVLFLDFHSTQRNVFYTQTKEDEPTAYDFTGKWMARGGARLPDYEFEYAERHNSELPTSKRYMYSRFAIPAITYELGDNTDRRLIKRSARVFADEMMALLLEYETDTPVRASD